MEEGQNDNQKSAKDFIAEIPEGIAKVVGFLDGLNAGEEIKKNLAESALETGVIKFKEKATGTEAAAATTEENAGTENTTASTETEENESASTENSDDSKKEGATGTSTAATEENVTDDFTESETKNPLLKKQTANAGKGINIENMEQFKAAAKKTLGIEIKSEKDLAKVINSTIKWREDSQKLGEVQETLSNFEKMLDETPAQLIDALKAYHSGAENWQESITKMPSFDFKVPVDKQDEKKLVANYFPGEFSDEDWTAEERPKALTIAIKSSREKFSTDKRELESLSAAQIKDANDRKEAKVGSISGSLDSLKNSFPDLDKTDVNGIKKIMEGGDIASLFFNKNGTYKPQAAKMIMLALYGEEALNRVTKAVVKRTETKVTEDLLIRGPENKNPANRSGAGGQKPAVDQNTAKKVGEFTKGINRKLTY